MKRAIVTLLSLLLVPGTVIGGIINPGDTASTLHSSSFAGPTGTLLAEKQTPFTIDYGADPEVGFDGKLNGTLHSAVYDVGGKLAFFYDVDFDPANFIDGASEQSELQATDFAGFETTVSGQLDFEEVAKAARSGDGSQVVLFSDSPGLGGAPALLVETDAMAYDENGTINFFAADEIGTANGTRRTSGSALIEGVYQPSAGGPTAIPLPPAAYSGLGVLLAMGLVMRFRRWQHGAAA